MFNPFTGHCALLDRHLTIYIVLIIINQQIHLVYLMLYNHKVKNLANKPNQHTWTVLKQIFYNPHKVGPEQNRIGTERGAPKVKIIFEEFTSFPVVK